MSGSKDLYSSINVSNAFAAATVAANTNSNGIIIDTFGAQSHTFLVQLADVDAGETVTIKLQDGDASNLSDAADCGGADVLVASNTNEAGGASTVAATAAGVYKIGYVGNKRYVRLNIAVAGGSDGVPSAAVCVHSHLDYVADRAF